MSLPPGPPVPSIVDPELLAEVARRVDFRLRSRGLWSTVTIDGNRVMVSLPRPLAEGMVNNSVAYSRAISDVSSNLDCPQRADGMAEWILGNEEVAAMLAWNASEKAHRT